MGTSQMLSLLISTVTFKQKLFTSALPRDSSPGLILHFDHVLEHATHLPLGGLLHGGADLLVEILALLLHTNCEIKHGNLGHWSVHYHPVETASPGST